MGNLFYDQLQKECKDTNFTILREVINADKRRAKDMFERAFDKQEQYEFYYGMYLAYNNVLTMISTITKEGEV